MIYYTVSDKYPCTQLQYLDNSDRSTPLDAFSGPLQIALLTKDYEEKYSEYVAKSPEATIYHTLAWRDISCAVFNHTALFLVASERGVIRGVFPLFLVKGVLGRRLVSVPLRDKGGPLYDTPQILAQLLDAAEQLMRRERCAYLEIKTWHGLDFEHYDHTRILHKPHMVNSILPLDKNPEVLWKGLDKRSARKPIQKSQKEGVRCNWATSLEDMKKFYELFVLTRKKLGVPPYGFNLFHAIWERLIQKGSAGLVLAHYRDMAVSGLVVFFSHNIVWGGYAASNKKYLHLRVNDLLIWTVIQDACERGYAYFDFGGDSPHNQGLIAFKRNFGAATEVLPYYYMFNGASQSPDMDPDSPKYRFMRKVFALLPVGITRRIGPIITRQIS